MTDFLGQMLRRSRHEAQERKRFYASLNEINPTSLAAIQASQTRAAVAAASSEAALRASMAAQAAADEAKARLTSSAAAASSSTKPVAASTPAKTVSPASSSAAQRVLSSAAASSSSSSSSAAAKSSASPSSSSSPSSVVPSSSSSAAGRPVMTITQTPSYAPSSASASSAAPSGSVAAASSGTESTGMSTGGVIGAVAAGLVGLVIIGALCGWLFRKHSARKNSVTNEKNWRQIGDDNDGYNRPASPYHDDIYGQDAAPVIGSRRALAMARANAHEDSRPPTMMERNVAGAGAWRQQPDYGAYPAGEGRLSPESYGLDPHSRPYMQQAGRVPIIAEQYQYQNAQPITPDTSRQLISPLHPLSANNPYSPSFVPGRPGVPQTDRQIAQHEDFADFPSAALDRDEMDQDWAPHTATTNGDWPVQQMPTPQLPSPSPSYGAGPQLPMLPPMSPDSFGADFAAAGQSSSQKQVYADVARAAGVMEPVTPTPAQAKYAEAAAASSSSSRGLPPLPVYSREAPSPFQHGRPLSALEEVETPLSTPMPSTAGVHAYGQNPFDDVPLPASRSQGSLAQPQAPSTPVSAARYPPPSTPLAPESVTSSPMRGIEERTGWHSAAPAHRLSHMTTADDDDVYGGI